MKILTISYLVGLMTLGYGFTFISEEAQSPLSGLIASDLTDSSFSLIQDYQLMKRKKDDMAMCIDSELIAKEYLDKKDLERNLQWVMISQRACEAADIIPLQTLANN